SIRPWPPRHRWPLVPRATVQEPPTRFRRTPAPLLVEEGYPRGHAAVAQVPHPARLARAAAWPTLTAGDHPIEMSQFKRGRRTQQRLGADEPDAAGARRRQ